MNTRMFLLVIWCVLIAPLDALGYSTGLEANNLHFVHLCINVGGDGHKEIPIDSESVQAKVEFLLRSAGLRFEIIRWHDFEETLDVVVQVVGDSFRVSVEFWRSVDYRVKGKGHFIYAPVYSEGIIGTHAGRKHFILDCVGESVEKFLTEYLRVNGPSQRKSSKNN